MVLDTRTLDSFYALADVVRDYTTPSRGSRELTDEEKDQACRLRADRGWHAWHIAEALGLSAPRGAWHWEENIVEALEDCTLRTGWGKQNQRLTRSEATVEGTNIYGDSRKYAWANAIIEAVLSQGRTGMPDLPGAGSRARDIGRAGVLAGKDLTNPELAARADRILASQVNAGLYPGLTLRKLNDRDVMKALTPIRQFVEWKSKKPSGIRELPKAERAKIDAEIMRRCKIQAKLTPKEAPDGFWEELATAVYTTTPCCGPDGKSTMEDMDYAVLQPLYVGRICRDNKIFVSGRSPLQAQIDDPVNQKLVKDAMRTTGSTQRSTIMKATGLQQHLVEGIMAALGTVTQTVRQEAIRKIVLPLHAKRLTPTQMWDQSPDLQKEWPDKKRGVPQIYQVLTHSNPPLVPWTAARLRAERQVPELAFNIKDILLAHLRGFDDDEVKRIQGNLDRVQLYFEETNISVDDMAQSFTRPGRPAVTPEIVRGALELLFTETPQLVTYHPDRPDEIVLHREGLREFVGRGR